VIFLESAAVGDKDIEGGNPIRKESIRQAAALDAKLHRLWAQHPRFVLVRHNASFLKKISFGLAELDAMVSSLTNGAQRSPSTRRR
jgi:protoheme ferro-lyase